MKSREDLERLRVDLSSFTDEGAYKWAESVYLKDFMSRSGRSGMHKAHDGEEVTFFNDRCFHAFRTSHDRARHPYSKKKVARDRIERINWIRLIIEGNVAGIECWEVPLKVPEEGYRNFPGKRLYVYWEAGYIVWLEPLKKGGFKFSSSYVLPEKEIKRYIDRGRIVWRSDSDA